LRWTVLAHWALQQRALGGGLESASEFTRRAGGVDEVGEVVPHALTGELHARGGVHHDDGGQVRTARHPRERAVGRRLAITGADQECVELLPAQRILHALGLGANDALDVGRGEHGEHGVGLGPEGEHHDPQRPRAALTDNGVHVQGQRLCVGLVGCGFLACHC
jgi:hypothetical protein